ncbi:MAG: GAF and ANTAR domain-containing protein [Acidimicrobiales bacterium]
MPSQRLLRILSRLRTGGENRPDSERLCAVAAEMVGADGAGIMLLSGGAPSGTVCTSNAVSAVIEELQFTLGEGPCLDAYRRALPVLEPDLADPDAVRWPAFAPPAVDAGVRAIFGFPLLVGAVCLGALDLYRTQPGALEVDELADALVMAGVAARSVLTMQSDAMGGLADGIEDGSQVRFVVHQASGMVAVQLSLSVGEALVRLRAFAFANDRGVTEVAEDVVARRIRFDDAPGGAGSGR